MEQGRAEPRSQYLSEMDPDEAEGGLGGATASDTTVDTPPPP